MNSQKWNNSSIWKSQFIESNSKNISTIENRDSLDINEDSIHLKHFFRSNFHKFSSWIKPKHSYPIRNHFENLDKTILNHSVKKKLNYLFTKSDDSI